MALNNAFKSPTRLYDIDTALNTSPQTTHTYQLYTSLIKSIFYCTQKDTNENSCDLNKLGLYLITID